MYLYTALNYKEKMQIELSKYDISYLARSQNAIKPAEPVHAYNALGETIWAHSRDGHERKCTCTDYVHCIRAIWSCLFLMDYWSLLYMRNSEALLKIGMQLHAWYFPWQSLWKAVLEYKYNSFLFYALNAHWYMYVICMYVGWWVSKCVWVCVWVCIHAYTCYDMPLIVTVHCK